jgi:hypothetical protein
MAVLATEKALIRLQSGSKRSLKRPRRVEIRETSPSLCPLEDILHWNYAENTITLTTDTS